MKYKKGSDYAKEKKKEALLIKNSQETLRPMNIERKKREYLIRNGYIKP